MKLSSPAFVEGELIPSKYTCDGENVSPPLEWDGVPDRAKLLALIVEDPDAPSGLFVHWLLFPIPASEKGLTQGGRSSESGIHGKNGFGKIAWGGPCPPAEWHAPLLFPSLCARRATNPEIRGNSERTGFGDARTHCCRGRNGIIQAPSC